MTEPRDTKSGNTLARPLGKAERFYWLYDRVSCTNFVVVAEFDELPPREPLIRALDTARRRHPLLGVRIVIGDEGEVCYEPGPAGSISVPVVPGGQQGWRTEIIKQLDARFPDGAFPLLRCMAIPSTTEDGTSAVVFTFHHGVTDAGAATRLVEEVLTDALLGLPVDDSTFPARPPQEALYDNPFRGIGGLLRRLWYALTDALERIRRGTPRALPDPFARGRVRSLVLERIQLRRDRTVILRHRCRKHRTTIHGVLGAVQLMALSEEFRGEDAGNELLGSAIGMRERLKPPVTARELGMFISMVRTQHHVGEDVKPWDLARDVKAEIERRVTRGDAHLLWSTFPPNSQFPPSAQGAAKLASVIDIQALPSILTNIGRVGPEAGSGPIRALHFAMAPHTGCALVTAVCSYRGQLVANCTFDTRMVDAYAARRVRKRMKVLLEEMSDPDVS